MSRFSSSFPAHVAAVTTFFAHPRRVAATGLMPKRTFTRWFLPLIVAVAASFVAGAPTAGAEGGGANNVVLVTTTADGSSLNRSALQVSQVGGPTVVSSNLAVANSYACTGCRSVAVAFQAVVVTGDADNISPANAAVATNDGCNSCTSYAYAYQYVLSARGPLYLNPSAQTAFAGFRAQIADLAASGLSLDELTAQLDAVAAQFKATVDAALHPVNGVATARVDAAPAG
jgi:putative peptide zinc metalloprotease protein